MDNQEKLSFILRASQWRPRPSSVIGTLLFIGAGVVYWYTNLR